jgi:hypothetical protein
LNGITAEAGSARFGADSFMAICAFVVEYQDSQWGDLPKEGSDSSSIDFLQPDA